MLKLADTDGDGRTMWKELCASKRIKYGQYGNLAIDNENSEKQIIDRYDIARDGVVDRERAAAISHAQCRRLAAVLDSRHARLSRPQSPRRADLAGASTPTTTASFRPTSGSCAAALLASRDSDDDEILLASDLNPRLQTARSGNDGRAPPPRSRCGPPARAACRLGHRATGLEQEYGGGRLLRADSFPLTPRAVCAARRRTRMAASSATNFAA